MATYWKALTYEPKVQAVIEGSCTQTIHPEWNIEVGDMIGFHGWGGKPYRSEWTWRAGPYQVIEAQHKGFYGKLEGQKFQVIKWKWKPQGFIDNPPPTFPELRNAEVIEL